MGTVARDSSADTLAAAGRVAMLARDSGMARGFFLLAVDRDAASFRATLGGASTALMQRDFDTASRTYAAARDRTKNKDEQKYLSAALDDLRKITVPTK